jgi:hypothetical protein
LCFEDRKVSFVFFSLCSYANALGKKREKSDGNLWSKAELCCSCAIADNVLYTANYVANPIKR